jgi:alkylation response protein AidB-like acyl-CoA dehydrogenase
VGGLKTTAEKTKDGKFWIINGTKKYGELNVQAIMMLINVRHTGGLRMELSAIISR